jgi:hypothetical protein
MLARGFRLGHVSQLLIGGGVAIMMRMVASE